MRVTEGVRWEIEAQKKIFFLHGLLPSLLAWPCTPLAKSEEKEGLLAGYYNEHIRSSLRGILFKKNLGQFFQRVISTHPVCSMRTLLHC